MVHRLEGDLKARWDGLHDAADLEHHPPDRVGIAERRQQLGNTADRGHHGTAIRISLESGAS